MSSRLELHDRLCKVLSSLGVWLWDPFNFEIDSVQDAIDKEAKKHVYFQPPESVKMSYPCIVYALDDIDLKHANDKTYLNTKRYVVTIIDKDPDSIIPDNLLTLPMCSFDRFYTAENLNHWVFNLYY